MMKYPMKNVEIITNIGWLLLIFFTRERRAEARYRETETEMITRNIQGNRRMISIVLLLELMVRMPRIISPGFKNAVTAKIPREDRK